MNVLLVEDNTADAALIEEMLSGTPDIAMDRVDRLAAAMARLEREDADVILLDLNLPDSLGLDTFRKVRDAAPDLPVIILSGLGSEETAMTAMQEGAQDYLVKDDVNGHLLIRSMRYAIERARISRALAEERQLMDTLLEGTPDRIYFKDRDSRFILVNHSLATLFGLDDPREAIGTCDADYFDNEHATEAWRDEQELMRTGVPIIGKVEKEILTSGGIAWVLTTKMVLRDHLGRVIGTFGTTRDITGIKEAAEQLTASEHRYRRLLESVTDYSYTVFFRDGAPVRTEHSEGCVAVTGYRRGEYEIDGKLWLRMIHPDDSDAVIENFSRITAGGPAEPIEHRIIHKDGTTRWVRNSPAPRFAPNGDIVSYDGVVADITERKDAELQLIAANARLRETLDQLTHSHHALKQAQLELIHAEKMESIGRLAAGIAHEVKNPLAVMLLGLECLAREPDPHGSTAGILSEMTNALDRANTVITGLLDFASSKDLALVPCGINAVVERSLDFVRHLLTKTHVSVRKELGDQLPNAILDSRKMEQVFINLFTNACHAMPDGGALTLRTRARLLTVEEVITEKGDRTGVRFRDGERVLVVEVCDNGSGIPSEKVGRVFDPFFTTKPTGQGTGLGLSVTKKIIDLHGGRIELRNRESGGVCATVTLRCQQEKSTP